MSFGPAWLSFLRCLVITAYGLVLGTRGRRIHAWGTSFWVGLLLLALVIGCALFTIRGYTVTPDAILIHRLSWATRLPLAGLRSAEFKPISILRGIRIGNGVFFSFTGFRYSPGLGFYRVFVTDHRQAVVLRYPNRVVVVSPDALEEFVRELAVTRHAA